MTNFDITKRQFKTPISKDLSEYIHFVYLKTNKLDNLKQSKFLFEVKLYLFLRIYKVKTIETWESAYAYRGNHQHIYLFSSAI